MAEERETLRADTVYDYELCGGWRQRKFAFGIHTAYEEAVGVAGAFIENSCSCTKPPSQARRGPREAHYIVP